MRNASGFKVSWSASRAAFSQPGANLGWSAVSQFAPLSDGRRSAVVVVSTEPVRSDGNDVAAPVRVSEARVTNPARQIRADGAQRAISLCPALEACTASMQEADDLTRSLRASPSCRDFHLWRSPWRPTRQSEPVFPVVNTGPPKRVPMTKRVLLPPTLPSRPPVWRPGQRLRFQSTVERPRPRWHSVPRIDLRTNMVLQRTPRFSLRHCRCCETVVVEFQARTYRSCGLRGAWTASLAAMPASTAPSVMTSLEWRVDQPDSVQVGEVWLCSASPTWASP